MYIVKIVRIWPLNYFEIGLFEEAKVLLKCINNNLQGLFVLYCKKETKKTSSQALNCS